MPGLAAVARPQPQESGQRLFLREAEVTVGPKIEGAGTSFPSTALVFKTRVNFSIKKNAESHANTSRISMYNLAPKSRSFIEQFEKRPGLIWLKAGYEDKRARLFGRDTARPLLFFGDVKRFKVDRRGPDIVTTVEGEDGGDSITKTVISIGLAENATNQQVFEEIAKQMKLSLSTPNPIPRRVLKKGFTETGLAHRVLSQITKTDKLEWSVQTGELQILPTGKDIGVEAVVLTPETGLLGIPTKTKDGLQVKSLLNPKISPGRAVVITSEFLRGAKFLVTNVQHDGDTFEGQWETDFEAVALG